MRWCQTRRCVRVCVLGSLHYDDWTFCERRLELTGLDPAFGSTGGQFPLAWKGGTKRKKEEQMVGVEVCVFVHVCKGRGILKRTLKTENLLGNEAIQISYV